jgi:hypothetical protein
LPILTFLVLIKKPWLQARPFYRKKKPKTSLAAIQILMYMSLTCMNLSLPKRF